LHHWRSDRRTPSGDRVRRLELGTTLLTLTRDRLGLPRAGAAAPARLVDDGLVETKPQSFTRVTPVVDREVRDAVQVVRAMHELVVGLAVPLVTPEDIADMAVVNTAFTKAIRTGDVEAALEADDAFHDIPVRVARNRPARRRAVHAAIRRLGARGSAGRLATSRNAARAAAPRVPQATSLRSHDHADSRRAAMTCPRQRTARPETAWRPPGGRP
jgi:DNA-binding GntR family transcriptional regulator